MRTRPLRIVTLDTGNGQLNSNDVSLSHGESVCWIRRHRLYRFCVLYLRRRRYENLREHGQRSQEQLRRSCVDAAIFDNHGYDARESDYDRIHLHRLLHVLRVWWWTNHPSLYLLGHLRTRLFNSPRHRGRYVYPLCQISSWTWM